MWTIIPSTYIEIRISEWLTTFQCAFSLLGQSLVKVFNFEEVKLMDKIEVHASNIDIYAFILSVSLSHKRVLFPVCLCNSPQLPSVKW